MTLITKGHLSLILQSIKKLLSFKIDRSEVREIDAIQIATKTGLISPTVAEDGSIYTDENGVLYTL
jgi:hypothetical protein